MTSGHTHTDPFVSEQPLMDVHAARTVLEWALDGHVFPGATVDVGTSTTVLWQHAVGRLSYDAGDDAVTPDTVYDLASLTKVIATATVAMRLIEDGTLQLEAPVGSYLPRWSGPDRDGVAIRDLLEHASGLPGWVPMYREAKGRRAMLETICRWPLAYEPRTGSVYSDVGFILLGLILETCGGAPLDRLFTSAVAAVCGGAGAGRLTFLPPASWQPVIAPCRLDDDRGPIGRGDVDDTNAWALGGVAGHAGLFGTAPAVGTFARSVLRALRGESAAEGRLADPHLLRRFATRSGVPGSSRALAWDTMRPTSSCGTRLSPGAIGHTGFTGTSLWIDPDANRYVVLLSNRVHPRATGNEEIQTVRRALHDAVMDAART
jgi:CubicO group peptidase (beta-lactamase class C family)